MTRGRRTYRSWRAPVWPPPRCAGRGLRRHRRRAAPSDGRFRGAHDAGARAGLARRLGARLRDARRASSRQTGRRRGADPARDRLPRARPVRRCRGRSEGGAEDRARLRRGARGAGYPLRRADALGGGGGAPRGGPARAQQPGLSEQPRLLPLPAPALQGGDHGVRVGGAAGAAVAAACGPTSASPSRRPAICARAAREFQMGGTEAEAKNNLGFAYERRGDMANAYELYFEAVRLDPVARARSNLVHAAMVLGRPVPPEARAAARAQAADDAPDAATNRSPPMNPKRRRSRDKDPDSCCCRSRSSRRALRWRLRTRAPQQQLRPGLHGVVPVAAREQARAERAGSRRIIEGLDAQEAGAVSKNYRKAVSKGDEEGGSRMLMIGPRPGAAAETGMSRRPRRARGRSGRAARFFFFFFFFFSL